MAILLMGSPINVFEKIYRRWKANFGDLIGIFPTFWNRTTNSFHSLDVELRCTYSDGGHELELSDVGDSFRLTLPTCLRLGHLGALICKRWRLERSLRRPPSR